MENTQLTDREREFFEKLHALCVEYNVSIYGDAEDPSNYTEASDVPRMFNFSIEGKEFREIHVNHRDTWPRNPPAITSVKLEGCFDLVLHKCGS